MNFQLSFKCHRGGEQKTSKHSRPFSLLIIKLSFLLRQATQKYLQKMIRNQDRPFLVSVRWVVNSQLYKKSAFCWPPKERPKNTRFPWLETNFTFTPTNMAQT